MGRFGKIPKICNKCKSPEIRTEIGNTLISIFRNGKLIKRNRMSLDRRVFCNDCFTEQKGSGELYILRKRK